MMKTVLLFGAALALVHAAELRGTTTTAGSVTKLRLIDAATNQPIAGYDPLASSTVLDLSTLPSSSVNAFSVEAMTQGTVGSIQWNDAGRVRNDDYAPYSMCGNSGPDFFACARLKVGANHTIVATPYSERGGLGTAGSAVTILLAIVNGAPSGVQPPELTLVNAETDQDIGPLVSTTIIDLSKTPKVNVRATPDPSIQTRSVQFSLNGNAYRTDSGAPFSLNGNSGGNYYDWTPAVGRYTIAASTYSEREAKGILTATATVSFTVISTPATAPVTPTKAPIIAPPRPTPITTKAPRSAPIVTTKAPVVSTREPVVPTSPAPTTFPTVGTGTVPPDNGPELVSLTFRSTSNATPPLVDVANGTVSIDLLLVVVSNYVGPAKNFLRSTVVAVCQGSNVGDGSTRIMAERLNPDENFPGRGQERPHFYKLTFPQEEIALGTYNLTVTLEDAGSTRVSAYPLTVQNSLGPSVRKAIASVGMTTDEQGLKVNVVAPTDLVPFATYIATSAEFGRFGESYSPGADGNHTFTFAFDFAAYQLGANIPFDMGFAYINFNTFITLSSQDLIARGYPGVVVVPATSNTRFPTRAPVTTSPTRSPASTNRPVLQPSPTSDPKPRLLNMTLLNHPSLTKDGVVDVANGPVTLTVEMTVVARLQKECVFFPFNSYCNDGTSFTLEATCRGELGKGDTRITAALQPEQDMPNYTPVTLKYDLVFPKNNIALGPCNFTLVVLDRKQNYYLGLDTAAMAAQGYPSRLTVINSQGTSLQNMFVGFEITYESLFYHQIYVSCRRSADFAASQLLEYGFNGVMRADNADRWGGKPTPWFSVDDNEINTYNFNYNNFDGDSLYNVTLGVELLHSNANIRSRLGPQDLAVLGFPNTTVVVRRQF